MIRILAITSDFRSKQFQQRLSNAVIETQSDEIRIRRFINTAHFDMIILDTTYPNVDGWALLRYIRSISDTPLMCIVNDGIDDVLSALTLGADDCVTHNININVMNARLGALLRRTASVRV